ncbi:MAG: Rieske 2Fe-2S domain-containing protein [Paracoccaceae bacterium]
MHKATLPLLTHCPEGLPAEAYFAPAWFAREQAGIWGQSWIYAGRLADLRAGTMRRVKLADETLVLCRNAGGDIAAFHNTCSHRGAELCELDEKPLNGKLITCPYHAWAYGFDGRLVSTAFATPTADFNKAEHGLHKVHHMLWNGLIFLSLAETPPALAPDIGLNALDNWPMEDLANGHSLTLRVSGTALATPHDSPGGNAPLMFAPAKIAELFTALDAARFQIHIHAIGDYALRAAPTPCGPRCATCLMRAPMPT